jgi:hypothetical protein
MEQREEWVLCVGMVAGIKADLTKEDMNASAA